MARPKKNNADYFSHDNDMRNDDKIKALRNNFGHEGYSVWNMLLEKLCRADGFELVYDDFNVELWSGDFDIKSERLDEIIQYLLKIRLILSRDDDNLQKSIIYSQKMIDRFGGLIAKRNRDFERLSKAKIQSKEVIASDNTQSKVNKSKVNKSKVNKSKVNKSKVNKIKEEKERFLDFVFLTKDEHAKLIETFGEIMTKKYIEKINSYIGSKGKKYRSHYFTILVRANKDGTKKLAKDKLNVVQIEHEKEMTAEEKEKAKIAMQAFRKDFTEKHSIDKVTA